MLGKETNMDTPSENTKGTLCRGRSRILLADDHDLVREAIGAVLYGEGFAEVSYAASLPEAITAVEETAAFDLIFLDYDMPGMNGLEGLSKMLDAAGGVPVALLTGIDSPEVARKAIELGAAGYVPKSLSVRTMVSVAKFITAGEKYLPLDLMQRAQTEAEEIFSKRELDVLKGICEGKSNKEIAIALDLREVTIKLYVTTLCRKLGARNRTHAAMLARDRALF